MHKSSELFLNILRKSSGIFRRQLENSGAIACIQHKSLPNSTQLRGYNEGFVINAG